MIAWSLVLDAAVANLRRLCPDDEIDLAVEHLKKREELIDLAL